MKFVGNSVPAVPTSLTPSGVGDLVTVQYQTDRTPTTAIRTTDYTNATTSATTVVESRTLAAGTYTIECWSMSKSTVITTPTLTMSFATTGGTVTSLTGAWIWYTNDTAVRHGGAFTTISSAQTAIAPAGTATTPRPLTFTGAVTLSVAGTIAVKAALSATGATFTLVAGAWIRATPVL